MKNVTLELNIHQLNAVMVGLQVQADIVSNCTQAIQAQVQSQLNPQAAPQDSQSGEFDRAEGKSEE